MDQVDIGLINDSDAQENPGTLIKSSTISTNDSVISLVILLPSSSEICGINSDGYS